MKQRKPVEVPDEHVEAVAYERQGKSGAKQVRYILRTTYQGRRLTRFVDEATYRRYAHRQREPLKLRKPAKPLPSGIPICAFDSIAGVLSDEDAEAILKVIEAGCERVDED
ncbi:MAG: hypothetical protein NZM28_03735 [Fimbriimonadales bacterium]|nr:hypothetical protein [Fimbriimonadales bacterium]